MLFLDIFILHPPSEPSIWTTHTKIDAKNTMPLILPSPCDPRYKIFRISWSRREFPKVPTCRVFQASIRYKKFPSKSDTSGHKGRLINFSSFSKTFQFLAFASSKNSPGTPCRCLLDLHCPGARPVGQSYHQWYDLLCFCHQKMSSRSGTDTMSPLDVLQDFAHKLVSPQVYMLQSMLKE